MSAPGRGAMQLAGRVAVVTGAASGIGRGLALALARRGCALAIADIDAPGLARTTELLPAPPPGRGPAHVSRHVLDVASRADVAALPRQALEAHGRVDLLFNNAGVALGGRFDQVSEADFDWLMEINFHGVVRMTRAFLPALAASDDARIVNVSSVFGLIAPPGQCAYAASKFAVRGFSEALRHELAGGPIGVSVVHPGGVATAIARNARVAAAVPAAERRRHRALAEKALRLAPERAGEIVVRGTERRRDRILVGADAAVLAALVRFAPVHYWRLIARLLPQ